MTVDIYSTTPNDTLSSEELALYRLIMAYRAEHDLPAIALSNALTITAGRHATDTVANIWAPRLTLPPGANLHSWSDAPYYSDHRDPDVMWHAPERLGTGFEGFGFEISTELFGVTTPSAALASWQGSAPHDAVIVNSGVWADFTWTAIGIGIDRLSNGRTVMHVWFSDTADPDPARQVGSAGNNVMTGTGFADHISGLDGADNLAGLRGADNLAGLRGADRLFGGNGTDRLEGGAGRDWLRGGAGADTFVLNGAQGDRITDFRTVDTIALQGSLFAGLGEDVTAAEFHLGNAAATADQHLIYDASTGRLRFDADGAGDGAAVLLAVLTNRPALTFADFEVI